MTDAPTARQFADIVRLTAQNDATRGRETGPAATHSAEAALPRGASAEIASPPARRRPLDRITDAFRLPKLDGRLDDPELDATLLREVGAAPDAAPPNAAPSARKKPRHRDRAG